MVWDPARNRYFPAASQPARSSAGSSGSSSSGPTGARQGPMASRPTKRLKASDGSSGGRSRKQRKPLFAGDQASQLLAWQRSLAGPLGAGRDRV
jgi:hypothetical protein